MFAPLEVLLNMEEVSTPRPRFDAVAEPIRQLPSGPSSTAPFQGVGYSL